MEIQIILGILSLIGPIIGYAFAKRKNTAEAQGSELDNVDKAVTIWRKLAEDLELKLKAEIDTLRKDNEKLSELVAKLSEENEELRGKMKILDRENQKLLKQLTILNDKANA
jgi:predicted RNase H-like nuclease (RuvC/YqgF family)